MPQKRASITKLPPPDMKKLGGKPDKHCGRIVGGGEMGVLIRAYDWSRTPLGPIDSWPETLCGTLNTILNSPFPMFIWWGEQEMINFYNDAYMIILSDKHPDALGRSAQSAWSEIWDEVGVLAAKVFAKGEPIYKKNQQLFINRSGHEEETYFTFSYSPVYGEAGEVAGLFCAVIETTEEVTTRQKLQESEERFRNLADTAPMFIAMADESGNAVYFNKPWLEYTGKNMEEMKGLGWLSTLHPEDAPKFEKDFKHAFEKRIPISKEYRFKRHDGEYRWMLAIGAPRFTPDGHFSGYFGTYTDFHDLKQAQLAVQEREDRFRTLIETSPSAIQLVTADGKILYSSDSLKNVLGYTPEEIANTGITPYLHPDDISYFYEKFQEIIEQPQKPITLQYRVKHKDGSWAWLETIGVNHLDTPNINALLGNFRNITEQKKAEEKVRRSEERFRALAENIPNLAWMAQADGSSAWYNNRWYTYTGTNAQQMEGNGWQSVHDPAVLPHVLKKWNQAVKGRHEFEMVVPMRGADGTYRPFLNRAVPILANDGSIEQWVGTCTDISEQLKIQQTEARNKELLDLNQAKDEFISLTSHQLRTPATGVKQYIGMLLEGYAGELNDKQKEFAIRANQSNERELTIINDLLNVAQIDAGKMIIRKADVDFVKVVHGIVDEQATKFAERHQTVKLVYSDSKLIAPADERRIRMALENLIDNASKYTPPHKSITVSLRRLKTDKIRIEIKDQGVGIADEDHRKIFEKFVRIDNPLSVSIGGSGLGLYLVKNIIVLHGGTIRVVSRPHEGTSFIVTLPC